MARNTTRRRSSRRTPRLDFAAIEITGALLTPDIVARIASFDAADQTEEAYGVPPGLKIRDEIARYFRIAEALWHQFEAAKVMSPAASERFMLDLLKQCFGFDTIKAQKTILKGEREFPVRHAALGGRVPIVIAPVPAEDVRRTGIDESLTQFGDGSRRRSATLLLQEYLNAEDEAVWGICADGLTLRLLRDNVSLTRPAWIEADLAKIVSESLFPDFSALWLLIHQSRFGAAGSAPTDCALEHWRDAGRIEGTAAREKLRNGVEAALIELGQGFIEHPANAELRTALSQGKLTRQAYFEELLRLVYRLIFLFAAEDRDLLHTPGAPQTAVRAYAQGFSVGRLRERCTRRTSWDKNVDVWEGLKATFRALSEGQALLGLPALGGLFAQGQLPHLREARIENRRLLAAIWRLAWMRPEGQPLTRVNWRDMETEELGSVYEGLLELTPLVSATEKSFNFAEGAEGRGNARKTSGSYYTPDALVQALLDETLNPLIEETIAGKDDQAAIEALLNLRIIDPACGSGHFLLAAARRLASRIARLSSPGTPSQADYRHWLREVARRTLFGVDKNPMAIELAKVALWIETVEPGKPLSFLDAHLRCGDSLLGVYDLKALEIGIPDDAYEPLTGDDKAAASEWRKLNKKARERDDKTSDLFGVQTDDIAKAAQTIEAQDEDDLAAVRVKQEAYAKLLEGESYWRVKTACDLYVAAFLMPKVEKPDPTAGASGITIPTTSAVRTKLAGKLEVSNLEANAVHVARAAAAFHWPLEFPQIFLRGADGRQGFDLTLGNPPWERIKLQEQEFFSAREPEIAKAPNKAARQKLIERLEKAAQGSAERMLFDEFAQAKRIAEAASIFARAAAIDGGRFPLTGTGDINTYALFAELASTLAINVGIIIPTGIAVDSTNSKYFSNLTDGFRLKRVVSFKEIRQWFPDTDDRNPFCLFMVAQDCDKPLFQFGIEHLSEITQSERSIFLSQAEIAAINPRTKVAPVLRSNADAVLIAQVYRRNDILVNSENTSGWSLKTRTMFHKTKASQDGDIAPWADISDATSGKWLACFESDQLHQFDHRFSTFEADRIVPVSSKSKSAGFEITTEYAAKDAAYRAVCARWQLEDYSAFLAVRRVARAGDERTVIASLIPRMPSANNCLLITDPSPLDASVLCALLNSVVFDYLLRNSLTQPSIPQNVLEQIAVPRRHVVSDRQCAEYLANRVLELTFTSEAMAPFARDLGYKEPPFGWDEDRRALLRAELDAKIALLYGLTRDQLRYILDPADIYGPDYPSETFRVLKNNDIAKYGEYRTAKLVLDAWDRLERGELT